MSPGAAATRLLAIVLVVAAGGTGCARLREGTAVASPQPPHNVWQLAGRAVKLVPLNVPKMEKLLGVPLVQDPQTPGRWVSGPVRLRPTLRIRSAHIDVTDGAWRFTEFDIEPEPCITSGMIRLHYPSAELRRDPGHSTGRQSNWVVSYGWGQLVFGTRITDGCLTDVSLRPAGSPGQ
ncbi:MAG TPA: hypothetical protein VFR17_01675 [Mycobacterium sp.]|nr:hypothetical protein [Mycobacterium sp.]